MTEESKKKQKARQVREAREWLQQRFPAVFGGKGGVPLAIGAHATAHEAARAEDGPPAWAIRAALQSWTSHPKYLQGLAQQRTRRHLDGTEAQAVTDEQAERARERLAEVKRKRQQAREQEQRRQAKEKAKKPQAEQPKGKAKEKAKKPQAEQPKGKGKQKEKKPAEPEKEPAKGKEQARRPTITLKRRRGTETKEEP